VQVDGKLQFRLPGEPLFPELGSDAILYPTLTWQLSSDRAARLDAELSYVTGGMRWEAAYNLVAPEKGDVLDQRQMQEAFEIRIRNRKKESVRVRVAERLYRWLNWEIVEKSDDFVKTDAQSVEFVVGVEPIRRGS